MSVEGIDLSGWNKPQDWSAAKAAGVEFAFVKVSQGLGVGGAKRYGNVVDNYAALRQAGIWVGAYHFAELRYKGKGQAREQAENMVDRMEALGEWELPPVLDLEWQTYPGKTDSERKAARVADIGKKSHRFPASAVVDWTLEFGSRMVELTGQLPVLYTGQNFWRFRMGKADLSGWLLWLIDYMDDSRTVPRFDQIESRMVAANGGPWDEAAFWQWTGHGSAPWYKGRRVDRNLYNGTLEEFRGVFG